MKAQVAIEFMIIFGVFLVALTIVVMAAWGNVMNINESTIDFEAERILGLAAGRVNTAYLEGDGFSIDLALPGNIGVHNYTLGIEENILWLTVNGLNYSKRMITSNITGSFNTGGNSLRNVKGEIVIS